MNASGLPNTPGIYAVVSKTTGKRYIGVTSNLYRRCVTHKSKLVTGNHANPGLSEVVADFGIDDLDFMVLQEGSDCEDLYLVEVEYIETLNTMAPNGYNYNSGGKSQYVVCSETRKRLADRDASMYAEGIERLRKHNTGKKLTGDRLTQALDAQKLAVGAIKSTPRTEEHCRKLSDYANTEEAREKTRRNQVFAAESRRGATLEESHANALSSGYRKYHESKPLCACGEYRIYKAGRDMCSNCYAKLKKAGKNG